MLKYYLWLIFYRMIAKRLPGSYSKINFKSRKIREMCGKNLLLYCGNDVNIETGARFSRNVSLGDRSGLGENCRLCGTVTIGNDVMMGANCTIYTANHMFENIDIPMNQQGMQQMKPVVVEDNVWIGGNVTILPGIRVGKGSIIGAGSVVTKNVPDYAIVAGNPAIVKRDRREIGISK